MAGKPRKTPEEIIGGAIRATIRDFLGLVAEVYPSEGDTLKVVRAFFRDKSDAQLITYVERQIFPHSIHIKEHNLDFFKNQKYKIFEGLPVAFIDHYTVLVLELGKVDMERVWDYFNKFVELYSRLIKRKKNK